MKKHIAKNFLVTGLIAVLAWCPFFFYRLVATPYVMHQEATKRATDAESVLMEKKKGPHWASDIQFEFVKQKGDTRSWNVYAFQATIQPIRLKLSCYGDKLEGSVTKIIMTVGGDKVVEPWWKITDKGKVIELGYEGPALNMMSVLIIQIESRVPVRVLNIQRWKID